MNSYKYQQFEKKTKIDFVRFWYMKYHYKFTFFETIQSIYIDAAVTCDTEIAIQSFLYVNNKFSKYYIKNFFYIQIVP